MTVNPSSKALQFFSGHMTDIFFDLRMLYYLSCVLLYSGRDFDIFTLIKTKNLMFCFFALKKSVIDQNYFRLSRVSFDWSNHSFMKVLNKWTSTLIFNGFTKTNKLRINLSQNILYFNAILYRNKYFIVDIHICNSPVIGLL